MASVVSARDVEAQAASGRSVLTLPPDAVITPQARERARELGVKFGADGASAAPATPTPATPAAAPRPAQTPLPPPAGEGYAAPLHAPIYFRRMGQRVIWHKAVNVTFRADPAVLREFVPAPLELVGDEVTAGVT